MNTPDKEGIILAILSWTLVIYVSYHLMTDMIAQLYTDHEDWYLWLLPWFIAVVVASWITTFRPTPTEEDDTPYHSSTPSSASMPAAYHAHSSLLTPNSSFLTPNSSFPTIIAIVGPSGSGKTTASAFASRALDLPEVCSYTTRPMRPGEAEGREHHFVTEAEMPPRSDMLAYTLFGQHHYWTTFSQLHPTKPNLYVIDERGLCDLMTLARIRKIRLEAIYITAPPQSTVNAERQQRDADRIQLPDSTYSAVIHNTSSIEYLLYRLTDVIHKIIRRNY